MLVPPSHPDDEEASSRSRSPRLHGRAAESPTSAASTTDVLPHVPQHTVVHATVFALQEMPKHLSTRCSSTCSVETATRVFHDMCLTGSRDTELVPLRPQSTSSGLQFMLVPTCAFEAGKFPCLLDASWYGIPPFIIMSGPSITAGQVRDSFGADWPSSVHPPPSLFLEHTDCGVTTMALFLCIGGSPYACGLYVLYPRRL